MTVPYPVENRQELLQREHSHVWEFSMREKSSLRIDFSRSVQSPSRVTDSGAVRVKSRDLTFRDDIQPKYRCPRSLRFLSRITLTNLVEPPANYIGRPYAFSPVDAVRRIQWRNEGAGSGGSDRPNYQNWKAELRGIPGMRFF